MNKQFAFLTASIVLLTALEPAAATATQAPESQPQAMDSPKHDELHKLFERVHEGGTRAHKSYGDVMLHHIDELKLSDDQIGKIVRIHRDNQQKIKEIAKKLRETQRSAYQLFLNPASDEADIRNAAKRHTEMFDTLVDTALNSRAAINAVLTPEQLNRLKTLKAQP